MLLSMLMAKLKKNTEGGNYGIRNRCFGGSYTRYRDNEINLVHMGVWPGNVLSPPQADKGFLQGGF